MSSRTTSRILLVWSLLWVIAAPGAQPPGVPVTVDPFVRHPVDQTLRLSADGQTLVWVRVRKSKVSLCALAAPFTAARGELFLGPAIAPLPTVRLSFDGRHAFWNKDGQVWHASQKTSRFGQPAILPVKAGRFGFQCNADGSVLSMLIDGPSTATISPSYRAVAIANRTDGGWIQPPPLTSLEHGKLADGTLLDGLGRYLIFKCDGHKQAVRSQEGWKISPLEFPGYNVSPAALSVDGQVMLLRGRKSDERPDRPEIANLSHVWLSRRTKDRWQRPELVLRDREVNYYKEAMSPDGRWLTWVEYDRDQQMKIVRTRLRLMFRERKGWTKPKTVVDQKGFWQFWNTCIANNGTVAWTTIVGKPWKGYVRALGGTTICLD
jgi:hypothetical protein